MSVQGSPHGGANKPVKKITRTRTHTHTHTLCTLVLIPELFFSIYVIHDEVKDKEFELELSWVGAGMCDELVCSDDVSELHSR